MCHLEQGKDEVVAANGKTVYPVYLEWFDPPHWEPCVLMVCAISEEEAVGIAVQYMYSWLIEYDDKLTPMFRKISTGTSFLVE